MIRSGFFNSVGGDRKYGANKFAEYFASFIGNGVFPNPSTGLQVTANNDMTVTVKAGTAWINGYILVNDDDYILTIDVADGVLNRIDRVVSRYDTVDREIRLEIKKGAFASSPVAPDLQRDADAYELALADIAVGNGVVSITQANITDQRLNTSLCGIVHGVVDQVDTATLANQYQTWLSETQTGAEAEVSTMIDGLQDDWDIWFATVQDALDGDTAGNLLNLINANSAAIATKAEQSNLEATNTNVSGLQTTVDAHLADYTQQIPYGVTTGSANIYAVSTTPALPALVAGVAITVKINVANTGASTLNWNGKGAKAILDSKGNAMISGKLRLNGVYTLRYDGTSFILQGEGGDGSIMSAGESVLYDSGATPSTAGNSVTYTKVFAAKITGQSGVVRTKFDMAQTYGGGYSAYGMIFKNGVAVGTERGTNITSFTTYVEDISFNDGDTISVYGKLPSSGTNEIKNFKLCFAPIATATVI